MNFHAIFRVRFLRDRETYGEQGDEMKIVKIRSQSQLVRLRTSARRVVKNVRRRFMKIFRK